MPSSNAIQIIINSVYGSLATVIGVVTVFQGYKTYKMWHSRGQVQEDPDEDGGISLHVSPVQLNCISVT